MCVIDTATVLAHKIRKTKIFCNVINSCMDYARHYNALILKGQNRVLTSYKETHHIVPRCLGGSDDQKNLVNLTPEEHYIAHQLLVKIYPNEPKLIHAVMMMCANRKGNKVYGWLRKRLSDAQKINQSGEKNSQYGTLWINKNNKAIKITQCQLETFLSDGWEKGRKKKEIPIRKIIPTGVNSNKYIWILEEEEKILEEFDNHRSINRILTDRGFKNREGNEILSKFLKSRGRCPLRRRNSAGVA
jgi:hypothetical protein